MSEIVESFLLNGGKITQIKVGRGKRYSNKEWARLMTAPTSARLQVEAEIELARAKKRAYYEQRSARRSVRK